MLHLLIIEAPGHSENSPSSRPYPDCALVPSIYPSIGKRRRKVNLRIWL
jgi:hypothetical protein